MINETSSPAQPETTSRTERNGAALTPDPFACARVGGTNGERREVPRTAEPPGLTQAAKREQKDVGCPKCRVGFARRSVRTSMFERLISLLYWYPFTCQVCSHRFLAFQLGVRYTRRGVDRREFDRYLVTFPARLRSMDGAATGTVTALALNGCEVSTDFIAPQGTVVTLSVQMWRDLPDLVVEAAVVRSTRSSSLGIEFLKLDAWQRARLAWCVQGLSLDQRPER